MIIFRNNHLYNDQTNNNLKFIKTIAINAGGIRMISYLYEDRITQEKFTYTSQQLEELKRLGDNDIRIY